MAWVALLLRPGSAPSDSEADRKQRASAAASKIVEREIEVGISTLMKAKDSGAIANLLGEPLGAFVAPWRAEIGWTFSALALRPNFKKPPTWVPASIHNVVSQVPHNDYHLVERESLKAVIRALPVGPDGIRHLVSHHLKWLGLSEGELSSWQRGFGLYAHWPIPRKPYDHYSVNTENEVENTAAFGSFLATVQTVGTHALGANCDLRIETGSLVRADAFDFQAVKGLVSRGDEGLIMAAVRKRVEDLRPVYTEIHLRGQGQGSIHNWLKEIAESDKVSISEELDFVMDYLRRKNRGLVESQVPGGQLALTATMVGLQQLSSGVDQIFSGVGTGQVRKDMAETLKLTPREVQGLFSVLEEDEPGERKLNEFRHLLNRATEGQGTLLLVVVE